MTKINSFVYWIDQNPIIQKLLSTNTLTFQDFFALFEPLFRDSIPNKSLHDHIFVYLPNLLDQISNANSSQEYLNILQSVFFTHLQLFLDNGNFTLNSGLLSNLLNLQSVQYLFATNFEDLLFTDYVNVLIDYFGLPPLTQYQKDNLNIYLPDLIFKLSNATDSNEIYTILQPFVLSHLEHCFNASNNSNQLGKFLIDLVKDESTQQHLFVYLPKLIEQLSQAQGLMDVYAILDPIITSHLALVFSNSNSSETNQTDVLKYESVQVLLSKLTMDPSSLLISDLANIYIEYMNWPKLTQSQMNHLDIYFVDFVKKIQNANTTDWYSLLEPIVSYHLNYYLNVNPDILNNLVNGFLQNSTFIKEFMGLINPYNLLSMLNFTQSQSKHLLEYVPDLIFNLTQVNSTDELFELMQPVVLYHANMFIQTAKPEDIANVVAKVDMYYADAMKAAFDKEVEPLLNNTEFMSIIESFMINYMLSGDGGQALSDLYGQLYAYFMQQLAVPLKFIVEKLSPRIYEYAKNQTDTKVVLAYVVHAGEDLLHTNLITWGIPYDSVYVGNAATGTTTQSTLCTTATPKGIDPSIISILEELNKQLDDLNKFLGDLDENKDLKPFDLDDGGFDY